MNVKVAIEELKYMLNKKSDRGYWKNKWWIDKDREQALGLLIQISERATEISKICYCRDKNHTGGICPIGQEYSAFLTGEK